MKALFSDYERPFYGQARPLALPSLPLAEAAADIEGILAETADAHQAVWDGLDRNERVVLLAFADGQAPAGSIVSEQHRIPRSSLRDALLRLVTDQQLVGEDENGHPHLLDPLLAEWLRRR